MRTNNDSPHASLDNGTIVVAWDDLTGAPPSDRKQALRRSLTGCKVIVMGNPPGSQLIVLMQSLLVDGARMAAGVDEEGESYFVVQGMARQS